MKHRSSTPAATPSASLESRLFNAFKELMQIELDQQEASRNVPAGLLAQYEELISEVENKG